MKLNNKFNAKILLFGEYGIIKDSKGLAFAFSHFHGQLKVSDSFKDQSPLAKLAEHIKRSQILKKEMFIDQFDQDLHKGLYFDSNIPQGYGLGSSGALCAAIFNRYSRHFDREKDYTQEELTYLQELFSIMESFYHGTSSGLDPLISYFNRPLIIHPGQELEFIDKPQLELLGQFYLLDTQTKRSTSPLVHQFLKDCSDESYYQGIQKFMLLNNTLIDELILNHKENFLLKFRELSRLQYLYFEKMIPNDLKDIWLSGLEGKDYFLKLCGAGGGGFFMVYSPEGKVPLEHVLIRFN